MQDSSVEQTRVFKATTIVEKRADPLFVILFMPTRPFIKGMDELLAKKDVKHVWNESGGGHSWPNWQVYLSKYAPLLFRD